MTITTQEMEQLAEQALEMRERTLTERDAASDAVDAFYAEHGDIDAGDEWCAEVDRLTNRRDALSALAFSLERLRSVAETVCSDLSRFATSKETAK